MCQCFEIVLRALVYSSKASSEPYQSACLTVEHKKEVVVDGVEGIDRMVNWQLMRAFYGEDQLVVMQVLIWQAVVELLWN